MNALLIVFGLVCCFALSSSAIARVWTDTKGRDLEADIVGSEDSKVTLKLKNGKEVKVDLGTLSKADREFITKWKEQEEAKAKPSKKGESGEKGVNEEYFSGEWPTLISADVGMEVEESEGKGEFIYKTPHYEFICNAELGGAVVKRFALLFEATNMYMRQLPLGNSKAHAERGSRYKVYLFEKKSQYHAAGGPAGSAGVYMGGRRQIIMIPFVSLGLVKGASSWRVDYDKTNKTLPHEIAHQITDLEFYREGSRGWYTEGLAEYVAVTPYRSGKFSVGSVERAAEQYVTGFSRKDGRGRNLGTKINVQDLQKFMNMSYREFTANGNFNYGVGALLVTYFCHYDGEGDAANLKNFLRALKMGKSGDEAQKELLAGRTWDEMEASISKEWSKRGVKLKFE